MARFLVEFGGKFFEWSTVVDAPVSPSMDEEQLNAYIKHYYGEEGLRKLPQRLERIKATGTSCLDETTKKSLLAYNRAGEGEKRIRTEAAMVKAYTITPEAPE